MIDATIYEACANEAYRHSLALLTLQCEHIFSPCFDPEYQWVALAYPFVNLATALGCSIGMLAGVCSCVYYLHHNNDTEEDKQEAIEHFRNGFCSAVLGFGLSCLNSLIAFFLCIARNIINLYALTQPDIEYDGPEFYVEEQLYNHTVFF